MGEVIIQNLDDAVLARLDAIRARSAYTAIDATDLIREDRDR